MKTEEFKSLFAPNVLKKLFGLELLKRLAYPRKTDNKIKDQFKELYEKDYTSLKNALENDMEDSAGSISAGSNSNFILAYSIDKKSWCNRDKEISLENALELSENIKDELVAACEFLDKGDFNGFYDFVPKSKNDLFNKVYTHKYLYILYPQYISFYHADSWHKYYKKQLDLPKSKNYYDIEKYFLEKYPDCHDVGKKSRKLEEKYGLPHTIWIFTYNPNKQNWETFEQDLLTVKNGGQAESKWSCGNKELKKDERVYILQLGNDSPKGIIASGFISCKPHNDTAENRDGKDKKYSVRIKFDRIINFKTNKILEQSFLKETFPKQDWDSNSWGKRLEIKYEDELKLKEKWNEIWSNQEKMSGNVNKGENMINQPLNQILYGPPGTGKTYNTIIKAIEIIVPELIKKDKKGNIVNYNELKERFDDLKRQHRIEFVTFHQSYSYEEFVEGIKPDLDLDNNNELKYKLNDGIFKQICKNAKQIKTDKISNKVDFTKTRIFKMSLGANWENQTENIYNYCLENNVVALGWGGDKNFANCNTPDDFRNLDETWGAKAVEIFKNWIRIGDIILISNGNSNIKAIAKVIGNYEYKKDTEIRYCQFRKVEWLYSGDDIPVSKFYDKKLSQQAIYGFYREDKIGKENYNTIKTEVLNEIITGNVNNKEEQPYVLIIDEINRGNISKIFGELITLIESDKRTGNSHELKVSLPYSNNNESFGVPNNLYIIGTMNTSDRSIASIDIALRRRFKFVEMMPRPEILVDENEKSLAIGEIDLQELLKILNERISYLLDRDHQIGHSYFMNWKNYNVETLKNVWFDTIIPLLNEYFYSDWDKLQAILGEAKETEETFIIKINKPKLPYNTNCDDEDFYYNFSEKNNVSNKNFINMLKNAQFV